MDSERGRATMMAFIDAVNQHDLEAEADCLAAEMVSHDPHRIGDGREAFLAL